MIRIHHQHLRDPAHEAYAGEVGARDVAAAFTTGHAREGDGDREQRVAVGRRVLHELGSDDGALPGPVLDDHLLAEAFAISSATARATMSWLPPGTSGTTRRRGLAGNGCAKALPSEKPEQPGWRFHPVHSLSSFTCRARRVHSASRNARSLPVET